MWIRIHNIAHESLWQPGSESSFGTPFPPPPLISHVCLSLCISLTAWVQRKYIIQKTAMQHQPLHLKIYLLKDFSIIMCLLFEVPSLVRLVRLNFFGVGRHLCTEPVFVNLFWFPAGPVRQPI
jgi:hypothetical protein